MIARIKRYIKTLQYRWQIPAYRLIEKSGLFDPDYYLTHNPDVAASGTDPLFHYITVGFIEAQRPGPEVRKPGPLFDRTYYLHQIPTLTETTDNLILHYLESGWHSGCTPNPLVDPLYYYQNNPTANFSKIDAFSHFLRNKWKRNRNSSPTPYFDHTFYCQQYVDATVHLEHPQDAYKHFLAVGLAEKRRPSIYFDIDWYTDKTPISVFHTLNIDPISHYFMFGCRERKSPSPLFDAGFYLKRYQVTECKDLFGHFLRLQCHEDRQPCSWFDPVFYRETYLAINPENIPPLKHFLEKGLQERHYPNRAIADFANKPVLSVLVPVYNVDKAQLNNCIRSVVYQSYPHWELCLADDCSTDKTIRPLLDRWTKTDSRIKAVFLTDNSGISAATNKAAKLAQGEYLVFLDNDDELAPEALQTFVHHINADHADLYYSDEDLIGADGSQFSIFRKPDFNRELLLNHNYVTHCVVTRRTLFENVGGCNSPFDGAQDLDLFLRLAEAAEKIIHIPEILYHWRASAESTSINHAQKEYANEAGRKSIESAMTRLGIGGEALFTDLKFYYRAKRTISTNLSVSLIATWHDQPIDIALWLTRLIDTAKYPVRQIIVMAAIELPGDTLASFALKTGIDITCRVVPLTAEPAAPDAFLLADIKGDLVGFIDGELEEPNNAWLSALVEYAQHEHVGLVGGRIDYSTEKADEVTPIPNCHNDSPAYYARFLTECSVLLNGRHCPQEVLGISGKLCLVRRSLLRAVVGQDTLEFPYLFSFLDLSYKALAMGKTNIYTPFCQFIARKTAVEVILAGEEHETLRQEEKIRFQKKWAQVLRRGDPFYNRNIPADNGHSMEEFDHWRMESLPFRGRK